MTGQAVDRLEIARALARALSAQLGVPVHLRDHDTLRDGPPATPGHNPNTKAETSQDVA